MGKRQHQKDKMYITYTEWTTFYGGKKAGFTSKEENEFKRLPFDHCCLSLQNWDIPLCDREGNIFDMEPLLPFLKKFKINPVTGKPCEFKDLIKLNFYRNSEGELECPVLFKQLTNSSHIVAIATTGHVYLMEAVEQLNIKNKNWKDLITDKPFERKDIITLQDPLNLQKFNISLFHHVKNDLRMETEEEQAERSGDPQARLKNVNPETKYTLEELNRDYKEPTEMHDALNKVEKNIKKADAFNAAHYSTGAVAAAFTSTAMVPKLVHEAAIKHEDEVRYDLVKKKGYVRLITNLGPLNLELYCDQTPRACENFIKHCKNGYYDGTKFHRSIRNFMIQGGDPTGTGTGGNSIWGNKFKDEFRPNLSHTGRGVLSMANSGKHTNGSQFFITYRSCKHLDNKHTIFGRVVGGMETLNEMEKIEVDNMDKPIYNITLLRTQIFVDPFEEADEQLTQMREEALKKEEEQALAIRKEKEVKKELKVFKNGIGKYINPEITKIVNKEEEVLNVRKKIKKISTSFNFDNW